MTGVVARSEAEPTEEPPHRSRAKMECPYDIEPEIIRGKVGVLELAKQLARQSAEPRIQALG